MAWRAGRAHAARGKTLQCALRGHARERGGAKGRAEAYLGLFAFEIARANLLGQDCCAGVVFLCQTEAHLLQDEFYLFFLVHRPVRFYLQLVQHFCGL